MPKAALLVAPRHLEIHDRPRKPLHPGEVRARVLRAGTCGTDLAIWSGKYLVPLPLVLGHEWVGEVVEVGRPEDERWLGKRVTAEINNHCLARNDPEPCAMCTAGIPVHCLKRSVTGIISHDGAYQEEIVVPTGALHELPGELSLEEGVLVEPLAAALETFEMRPLTPGEYVVVLGAGRLGALVAMVAKGLGARVLAVTRTGRRDALFERLGIATFHWDVTQRVPPPNPLDFAGSPLRDRVLAETEGRGADVVVEVTGLVQGICTAVDLVRPRGTVCLKSTPGNSVTSFGITRIVVHEIRLQGSRCGPFDEAIRFQLEQRLPLADLIEELYPLERASEALERAQEAGKIVLTME